MRAKHQPESPRRKRPKGMSEGAKKRGDSGATSNAKHDFPGLHPMQSTNIHNNRHHTQQTSHEVEKVG